jgi:hypothetical protein
VCCQFEEAKSKPKSKLLYGWSTIDHWRSWCKGRIIMAHS